ncbi:MAG TPA: ester cyclase [Fibrobacteria bacterium]|nr:ester cyclase [Fibrobacteria bacterium]
MSIEQNKAIIQRYLKAWNTADLHAFDELLAPDFRSHCGTQHTCTMVKIDREAYKKLVTLYHAAFPDIKFEIDEMIAEGDKVVVRWTATGTHKGEFAGIPPTNESIIITATVVERIKDGKVMEHWANRDDLGLLQQLGVVPPVSLMESLVTVEV